MPANSTIAAIIEGARDKITGGLTQITSDHRYIHEGRAFSYLGTTGSLDPDAKYAITIKTPIDTSGVYVHLRPAKFSATANTMSMTIAEGSTTADGSVAATFNRNRNSNTAAKVILTAGVTVSAAGTMIARDVVGGGSNPSNNEGGAGGANQELILKPDTLYSIEIANIGETTKSTGYFELFWYEEAK